MTAGPLPRAIAEYIARNAATRRRPAWMRVAAGGLVCDAGGDLAAYGLASISPGDDARATAPFLDGLLPVGSDGLHLPWLEMDGRFADVHVLPDEGADWVLLLDATEEAERAIPFQQTRNDATLRLERLNRDIERKDVLAHCIVHDLKGPLSCMHGYLQLALSGDVSESQQHEFIEHALRQCRRQELLIHEILDVFAGEAGVLGADGSESVVMADIARRVVEDYSGSFQQAGRALSFDGSPNVEGVRVRGDDSRMERVFANLLENALRHTPTGGVARVRMHHAGSELAATVENEGAPVDEAIRARLFERFARGAQGGGSAGLGLFFCRITVERWEGSIAYRPRTGGGSCFEIRLPLAP